MAMRVGYKVYVDVGAEFTDDGRLMPQYLVWEDGIRYEIDTPVPAEIVSGGKTRNVEKGSYIFGETAD